MKSDDWAFLAVLALIPPFWPLLGALGGIVLIVALVNGFDKMTRD